MHYKNGREAKVGDPVIGVTYNIKGVIAGTLLSITPGPDACSAMVGITYIRQTEGNGKFPFYNPDTLVRVQGTSNHGGSGDLAITCFKQDYTHCSNLLHAEDAWNELVLTDEAR